jgi:hypothetical protein
MNEAFKKKENELLKKEMLLDTIIFRGDQLSQKANTVLICNQLSSPKIEINLLKSKELNSFNTVLN